MSRILEFAPSSEEALVSRVLVLVHQTVDDHFPSAAPANRQFTKTVFSDDGENTALSHLPTPGQFSHIEDTSPGDEAKNRDQGLSPTPAGPPPFAGRGAGGNSTMVVPPRPAAAGSGPDKTDKPDKGREERPPFTDIKSLHASQMTGITGIADKIGGSADWTTRITIAMLIAGLVMLAYVLLAPST